jgi:hypothetical protein
VKIIGAVAFGLLACAEAGPAVPPPDYSAVAGYYTLSLSDTTRFPFCANLNNEIYCEAASLTLTDSGAFTEKQYHSYADLNSGIEFHDSTVVQGRYDLLERCVIRMVVAPGPSGRGVRHAYDLTFTNDTTPQTHTWIYVTADSSTAC